MPEIVFNTRGAESIGKAHDQIDRRGKTTQKIYQQTGREAQNLARIEQKVIRDTETARERYNRKLRETKMALAGHANEVEIVRRAETQLKLEFARSVDANKKLLEQRKQAARDAIAEQKKLTTVVQEMGTEAEAQGTLLGGLATKVIAYGGSFLSIHAAVKAITAELQAQQDLIDKRVQAQLTIGESRNVLLRNLVGQEALIPQVQQAATSIANETGLSETPVNLALASAVSSTGGNVPLSIELVRMAAKFLKDRPQDVGSFAGTLADLTRVTQSVDPEVQLGLLAKVGQLSRVVSPELQAKNIAPALIGSMPFGGDAQTSGALFAALTGGSADVTGERTGTALVALAAQLEDAMAGTGSFRATKNKPGPIPGLAGITQLRERIAYLRSHPQDAKYFLDNASFEKKVLGPITQLLLDPSAQVSRDYQAALGQIGDNATLRRVGAQALGVFRNNALEPVAERGRRLSRLIENLQTRRAENRLSTSELEQLQIIAQETGSTALGSKLAQLRDRVLGGIGVSVGEAIEQIEARIDELEHPMRRDIFAPSQSNLGAFGEVPREPTREEREAVGILKEQVEQLKKSIEEERKTRTQASTERQKTNELLAAIARRPGGLLGANV